MNASYADFGGGLEEFECHGGFNLKLLEFGGVAVMIHVSIV